MPTVNSNDGTVITYEQSGNGPALLLVNGALSHRNLYGEQDLAAALADNFTVVFYDRRGRGDSSDTKPYSKDKEIEDIEALIQAAGGSVYLYGVSSGAALSLLAASKLGPQKVLKLAIYEPPFGSDEKNDFEALKIKIGELVSAGKSAEAVVTFMEGVGTDPGTLEKMKQSPEWNSLKAVGHTLVYDFEILGDGDIPADAAKNIRVPTLVMAGEKSFGFMNTTIETLGEIIPGAEQKVLKGQTHEVSAEALAPELKMFFR